MITDTMMSNDTRKLSPDSQKHSAILWLMILCSIMALTLSDFILPWSGASIAYDLAMILGMAAFACAAFYFPQKSRTLAVIGACASVVSALLFQAASLFGALLFLRLGLSALFVYALRKTETLVARARSYLPFTSCALVSYGIMAALQHSQIRPYFPAICAVCSAFAALFAALSQGEAPCGDAGEREPLRQGANDPLQGTMVVLLVALLIASQLFSSLDMYIFSQFSQARLTGSRAVFSACVALIGISYALGGGVAKKRGIPALFVASCVFSQLFLLFMLIRAGTKWGVLLPPLYVLSSAGIDLCIILSPTVLQARLPLPLSPLAGGVILFRISKLYLIPSLIPERWGQNAGGHPVFMLTILAAMCQMLAVIYIVIIKKDSKIAQLKDMVLAAETPRIAPPPIPSDITAREREVMHLLLAGKNRNEIADSMGIAFSTVNKHCVAIYRKTECASHLELLSKYGYSPAETSGSDPLSGTS